MMEYKGYSAIVEYDDEALIFHGDVLNTNDVITFEGKSVDEIEQAFKDSVDDYLAWCAEDGVEPERPYSGKFNVRISPELHKTATFTASENHISLNKFVEQAIKDKVAAL